MVNPYRRGLGLGGRGETLPYTGGGSARPLEPYRGGGRGVQLEDDPYADPSRTGPTYGDDGAGESTYGYGGPTTSGRASGPGNKGGRRRAMPNYDEPEYYEEGYDESDSDEETKSGIKQGLYRSWQGAGGDEQHEIVTERWRRIMRSRGFSEQEIEQIISEAENGGGP